MADTDKRKALCRQFMGKTLEAHDALMRERVAAENGLPPLPDFFTDMPGKGFKGGSNDKG